MDVATGNTRHRCAIVKEGFLGKKKTVFILQEEFHCTGIHYSGADATDLGLDYDYLTWRDCNTIPTGDKK